MELIKNTTHADTVLVTDTELAQLRAGIYSRLIINVFNNITGHHLNTIQDADISYSLNSPIIDCWDYLEGNNVLRVRSKPVVKVQSSTGKRGRKGFGPLAYSEKAYMKQCNKAARLEKKLAQLQVGSKSSRISVSKTAYMKQLHRAHRAEQKLASLGLGK